MSTDTLIITDTQLSRRDARSMVFHFLYAAESYEYQESLDTIIENFNEGFALAISPSSEIAHIARMIIADREKLDALYTPLLENWSFDRVSVCSRLTIRYGTWELIATNTPTHIVINEAIELAKSFAEVDAYRLVNGILDRVAQSTRGQKEVPLASDGQ